MIKNGIVLVYVSKKYSFFINLRKKRPYAPNDLNSPCQTNFCKELSPRVKGASTDI